MFSRIFSRFVTELLAFDMDRFVKDVSEALNSSYSLIILEGILLYEDKLVSFELNYLKILHSSQSPKI